MLPVSYIMEQREIRKMTPMRESDADLDQTVLSLLNCVLFLLTPARKMIMPSVWRGIVWWSIAIKIFIWCFEQKGLSIAFAEPFGSCFTFCLSIVFCSPCFANLSIFLIQASNPTPLHPGRVVTAPYILPRLLPSSVPSIKLLKLYSYISHYHPLLLRGF